MNNDTRDRTIRNETNIKSIEEQLERIEKYLQRNFRVIHIALVLIGASLLVSGVITTDDVKTIIAYIF